MLSVSRFLIFISAALCLLISASEAAFVNLPPERTPGALSIKIQIPIPGAKVILLEDARLKKMNRKKVIDFVWWGQSMDEETDTALFHHPLANAEVRVVDKAGAIVSSRTLDSPFAKLQAVKLEPKRPTFLASVQKGGFGVFNGEEGHPFAVTKDHKIDDVAFESPTDGMTRALVLINSAKTGWRVIFDKKVKLQQILQVHCRTDIVDIRGMLQIFTRYYFDGKSWQKKETSSKGYCHWQGENQTFPLPEQFPKP